MLNSKSDANGPSSISVHEALGRRAAETIFEIGLKAGYEEIRTATFARAAVGRLGELFGRQGLVRDMVEGAKQGAEALNVEAFHGVVEVIQNAEDQGATEVRLGIANDGTDQLLLLVHNGAPVQFHQLVAMSYAFLSTKREDAKATGRFGVGLKTLSRIASDMEIHCAPYHVDVETSGPRTMRASPDITSFYSRNAGETLLRLRLVRTFEWADFEAWFASLGSDVLLFLNSVRSLKLVDLRARRSKLVGEYVVRRSRAQRLRLPAAANHLDAARIVVRDSDGNEWVRYSAKFPVPRDQRRKNKATGPTTEISVAAQRGRLGRIFAGLPLRVHPSLPVAINAQFDPDTARFTVQESAWNQWILKRAFDLVEGVARAQALAEPADCWRWIPLSQEAEVPGQPWLTEQVTAEVEALHRTLSRNLALAVGGHSVRIGDVVYEDPTLSSLVTEADLRRLRPRREPLAAEARDTGRWRLVLNEVAAGERVGVPQAIEMFDWHDERPAEWFVDLASAALEANLGLGGLRSIVRSDATAIVPPKPKSGEILVLDSSASGPALALGLATAIHPIYSTTRPTAVRVRDWLEKYSVLRAAASGRDALQALARRDPSMELSDPQLLALREILFGELSIDDRKQLGAAVGAAVLLDGYVIETARTARGKPRRKRTLVRPIDAYLPATIDATGKRGWPAAAGEVAGLSWIHGRYKQLLTTENDQVGARAVLTALGGAVAPRLVQRPSTDFKYNRPATHRLDWEGYQADRIESLGGASTHLSDDYLSPDLDTVVADLVATPVRSRRARARALVATVAEHWRNRYADYAEVNAVHTNYGWVTDGPVPSTWLSRVASADWLSNLRFKARAPMDLAIPTPSANEVFGEDQTRYGAEFDVVVPRQYPVLEAMGITVDPTVSDVIEALKDLKAQDPRGGRATVQRAAGLYDLLAESCVAMEGTVRPDSPLGDMSVQSVRAAFGIGKGAGKGLIVADGSWWSPQVVFRGRPIFGRRRPFVPERRRADRLWEVLNVKEPRLRDCVDVLNEIAAAPLAADDEGTLIDVYRHLATLNPQGAEERDALVRVPLWSGSTWIRSRPIFAVDDAQVTEALARREPTWGAPVPTTTLGELPRRMAVTVLDLARFTPIGIDGQALAAGIPLRSQFVNAVEHLSARFARRDAAAFTLLRPGWHGLADARLAINPDLGIEIRIEGRPDFTVAVRAHAQAHGAEVIIAAASAAALGDEDAGGHAVASLFGDETPDSVDRDKVGLAWAAAWRDAERGGTAEQLDLAQERDADDPLEGLEGEIKLAKDWRSKKERSRSRPAPGGAPTSPSDPDNPAAPQAPIALRHLKSLDDLVIGDITIEAGRPPKRKGAAKQRKAGLKDPPEHDPDLNRGNRALARAYTEDEREAFAVAILNRILETDSRTLRDLRKVANLGADVVDNVGKYFEVKAAAGDMPDAVRLQYSEIERSLERPSGHWFLVIVAGLEEGFETTVRFIADPLKHLQWVDTGSVTFVGVRQAKALEIRLPEIREVSEPTA